MTGVGNSTVFNSANDSHIVQLWNSLANSGDLSWDGNVDWTSALGLDCLTISATLIQILKKNYVAPPWKKWFSHHVISAVMVSQMTDNSTVCWAAHSDQQQRIKYQRSALLAFCRVNAPGHSGFPRKGPVMRKVFPCHDCLMISQAESWSDFCVALNYLAVVALVTRGDIDHLVVVCNFIFSQG